MEEEEKQVDKTKETHTIQKQPISNNDTKQEIQVEPNQTSQEKQIVQEDNESVLVKRTFQSKEQNSVDPLRVRLVGINIYTKHSDILKFCFNQLKPPIIPTKIACPRRKAMAFLKFENESDLKTFSSQATGKKIKGKKFKIKTVVSMSQRMSKMELDVKKLLKRQKENEAKRLEPVDDKIIEEELKKGLDERMYAYFGKEYKEQISLKRQSLEEILVKIKEQAMKNFQGFILEPTDVNKMKSVINQKNVLANLLGIQKKKREHKINAETLKQIKKQTENFRRVRKGQFVSITVNQKERNILSIPTTTKNTPETGVRSRLKSNNRRRPSMLTSIINQRIALKTQPVNQTKSRQKFPRRYQLKRSSTTYGFKRRSHKSQTTLTLTQQRQMKQKFFDKLSEKQVFDKNKIFQAYQKICEKKTKLNFLDDVIKRRKQTQKQNRDYLMNLNKRIFQSNIDVAEKDKKTLNKTIKSGDTHLFSTQLLTQMDQPINNCIFFIITFQHFLARPQTQKCRRSKSVKTNSNSTIKIKYKPKMHAMNIENFIRNKKIFDLFLNQEYKLWLEHSNRDKGMDNIKNSFLKRFKIKAFKKRTENIGPQGFYLKFKGVSREEQKQQEMIKQLLENTNQNKIEKPKRRLHKETHVADRDTITVIEDQVLDFCLSTEKGIEITKLAGHRTQDKHFGSLDKTFKRKFNDYQTLLQKCYYKSQLFRPVKEIVGDQTDMKHMLPEEKQKSLHQHCVEQSKLLNNGILNLDKFTIQEVLKRAGCKQLDNFYSLDYRLEQKRKAQEQLIRMNQFSLSYNNADSKKMRNYQIPTKKLHLLPTAQNKLDQKFRNTLRNNEQMNNVQINTWISNIKNKHGVKIVQNKWGLKVEIDENVEELPEQQLEYNLQYIKKGQLKQYNASLFYFLGRKSSYKPMKERLINRSPLTQNQSLIIYIWKVKRQMLNWLSYRNQKEKLKDFLNNQNKSLNKKMRYQEIDKHAESFHFISQTNFQRNVFHYLRKKKMV